MNDEATGSISWAEIHRGATQQMESAGIESADLEARRLVEAATGTEGADYVLELHEKATTKRLGSFDAMLGRRLGGEPLQYVIGSWSFRQLDLHVNRKVLIPRPETEQLVSLALDELEDHDKDRQRIAVDLGTGSGAIGLSLASEMAGLEVWLTDNSEPALEVARGNLAGLGVAAVSVRIAHGVWFAALPDDLRGRIDLVATNPPYVGTDEMLPESVADWEPLDALFSGQDGLDDIRLILAEAPEWLTANGRIVIELAPQQASSAVDLALTAGFADTEVRDDQYGKGRFLVARL